MRSAGAGLDSVGEASAGRLAASSCHLRGAQDRKAGHQVRGCRVATGRGWNQFAANWFYGTARARVCVLRTCDLQLSNRRKHALRVLQRQWRGLHLRQSWGPRCPRQAKFRHLRRGRVLFAARRGLLDPGQRDAQVSVHVWRHGRAQNLLGRRDDRHGQRAAAQGPGPVHAPRRAARPHRREPARLRHLLRRRLPGPRLEDPGVGPRGGLALHGKHVHMRGRQGL
mmetsp:Transcript_100439/g.322229  ORF Transcript_100439/g.322229 Transcript_100439/m.322229 type:complete len:225 (-) Transcript_100439:481-1155(-)